MYLGTPFYCSNENSSYNTTVYSSMDLVTFHVPIPRLPLASPSLTRIVTSIAQQNMIFLSIFSRAPGPLIHLRITNY